MSWGWNNLFDWAMQGRCAVNQYFWDKGLNRCIEQLVEDLAKCEDPCMDDTQRQLCQIKAKLKFQDCVSNNNNNNPNKGCYNY